MSQRTTHLSVLRPARVLAILAICASVLLAAAGAGILIGRTPIVRDPENPAYARDAAGTFTGSQESVVRDPENPAYRGNTVVPSTAGAGLRIVRDPENPSWTGGTPSQTVTGGSAIHGATHGLK